MTRYTLNLHSYCCNQYAADTEIVQIRYMRSYWPSVGKLDFVRTVLNWTVNKRHRFTVGIDTGLFRDWGAPASYGKLFIYNNTSVMVVVR